MRGTDTKQSTMLSLRSPEQRVAMDHPLRRIKEMADATLAELSPIFDAMYSTEGRPSIPPERLHKASLLMAFYTVRSERLFCEQLDYNLMFCWFLDMNMVEESFDHSSFCRNRERLIQHQVAERFFAAIVAQARNAGLMSDEHFTVDGTLIDAWASLKSFRMIAVPVDLPSTGARHATRATPSVSVSESVLKKVLVGRKPSVTFDGHGIEVARKHSLLRTSLEPHTI